MIEKELYNFKDVATILDVSTRTVHAWNADGKIKAVKIGREWKVSREEVDRIKREGVQ